MRAPDLDQALLPYWQGAATLKLPRHGGGRRATVRAALVAVVTAVASLPAPVNANSLMNTGEYWIGIEGFRHVLSLYGGITWAPLGTMGENGLRLRAAGSFSRFNSAHAYTTVLNVGNTVVEQTSLDSSSGIKQTAHAMLGWQWTAGALTGKVFAGIAYAGERHSSNLSGQTDRTRTSGAAAALELWYNLSNTSWATLDLLYTDTNRDLSSRLRWGLRLNETFSVGPEVAWSGNRDGELTRAGAFLRYDNGRSEFNISVNAAKMGSAAPSLYLATQWMQRF